MITVKRVYALTLAGVAVMASLTAPDFATTVFAQSYAALDVPEGELPAVLEASTAAYEKTWNDLLVALLRADLAGADSATRLDALAGRVARAEVEALQSRIGLDALHLRSEWTHDQQRLRVQAAVEESLATVARGKRDFARADSLFAAALDHYVEVGEKRRTAWVWGSRGVNAFMAGAHQIAESLYREALVVRREIGDPKLIGNTLNALGSTNYLMNRYPEASQYYREAFEVREASGQLAALGSTMNYMGLTYVAMGHVDSADASFRRALELTVTQGDSARTLEVLLNHAVLLGGQGFSAAAVRQFGRALAIARELGNQRWQAQIEHNLGDLLPRIGRFTEAKEHIERAIVLREAEGDEARLANSLITLGYIGLLMRDEQIARPPLMRAVRLADSLGLSDLHARALNNLAVLAQMEGDATGARESGFAALHVAHAEGDSALVHDAAVTLGDLATEQGNLEEALRWRERAAAAATGLPLAVRAADTLAWAAALQLSGRNEQAEQFDRQVLDLARTSGALDLEWRALTQLGDVAERRRDYLTAVRYVREAASILDSLRSQQRGEDPSISIFGGRVFAVEALIHLLGKADADYPDSGFAEEAFLWSERSRARALLDLLTSGAGSTPSSLAEPMTLGQAQALMVKRGGEAMAVYSLGDSSSTLWLVTREGWSHHILPARGQLRSRIQVLVRSLARPERAVSRSAVRASRSLYETLLEPAAEDLRSVERLIVVPDGELSLVPFEALLVREPAVGEAPAPSDYLMSRLTISYSPSATVLAVKRSSRPGEGAIVLVGNPDFGSSELPPLPHTGEEIAAVASLLEPSDVVTLTGSAATRDAMLSLPQLADARMLHVATHGETNEVEPGQSRLWLACNQPGSAATQLTAREISTLHLAAEQVTLSACETGLGRIERGEGVIGLSRAFLAAGAQSLVVSLWRVNDASTADLMTAFYEELLEPGTRRDDALASAKQRLVTREETRSPFFWAPFILLGQAEPLD